MEQPQTKHLIYPKIVKYLFIGYLILIANTGYLLAYSHASWMYFFNVVLHVSLGLILIVPFIKWARMFLRHDAYHGKPFGHNAGRLGYVFMILATLTGLFIALLGKLPEYRWAYWSHVVLGVLACLFMISSIRRAGYNISVDNIYSRSGRWGLVVFVAAGVFPLMTATLRYVFPDPENYIENSVVIPETWEQAVAGGRNSPFYPGMIGTINGKKIDRAFLDDVQSCATSNCHPDIYKQWKRSPHQQSFLNAVELKQSFALLDRNGKASLQKFCASCHAPGLVVSGDLDATNGESFTDIVKETKVSCLACHAVRRVRNTMGNAAMVLEEPDLTDMALTSLGWIRKGYFWFNRVAPESHRNAYLKRFMIEQTGEFCSTCHKVTLEPPITVRSWVSGANHYDSWRQSSYGGSPVFSFFAINRQKNCVDCHMQPVPSSDSGSEEGFIKNHTFKVGTKTAYRDSELPVQIELLVRLPQESQWPDAGPLLIDPVEQVGIRPLTQLNLIDRDSLSLEVVIYPKQVGHFLPLGAYGSKHIRLRIELYDDSNQILFSQEWRQFKPLRFFTPKGQADEAMTPALNLSPSQMPLSALEKLVTIPPDAAYLLPATISWRFEKKPSRLLVYLYRTSRRAGTGEPLGFKEVSVRAPEGGISKIKEADLWNLYGAANLFAGNERLAELAFKKALQVDSIWVIPRINLGRLYLYRGQDDLAGEILLQTLKIDRKHPRTHFYLSEYYLRKKKFSRAMKHLRAAKKKFDEDVLVLLQMGKIHMEKKEYKKAIRAFRAVVMVHPENPVAHYYRMIANEKIDRMDKAEIEKKLFHKFSNGNLKMYRGGIMETGLVHFQPLFLHYVLPPFTNGHVPEH